jgi:hypothetical protein
LSTNQIYAGVLVLGPHYVTSYGLKRNYFLGSGVTLTDSIRTGGGQKYANLKATLKVLRGKFPTLSDADMAELDELQIINSTGKPFIVAIAWESEPVKKTLYGTLDGVTPFMDSALDRWDWPLKMTEQK